MSRPPVHTYTLKINQQKKRSKIKTLAGKIDKFEFPLGSKMIENTL